MLLYCVVWHLTAISYNWCTHICLCFLPSQSNFAFRFFLGSTVMVSTVTSQQTTPGLIPGLTMSALLWVCMFSCACVRFLQVPRVFSYSPKTYGSIGYFKLLIINVNFCVGLYWIVNQFGVYPAWSRVGLAPTFPLKMTDWMAYTYLTRIQNPLLLLC